MENKNNEKVDFSFFNEDEKLAEYGRALQELRKDGVDKIASLKNHIYALKKNRLIDDAVKISSIEEYKKEIEEAKKTALENKDAEKKLAAEAVAYSNKLFNDNIRDFIKSENQKQKQYKIDYENQISSIMQENEAAKKEAYDDFAETKDSAELNRKLNVLKFQLNSSFAVAKNKYRDAVATSKEAKNQAW